MAARTCSSTSALSSGLIKGEEIGFEIASDPKNGRLRVSRIEALA
jgi:hypothetical protein